jgi:DNA-directed RNA polymerase specialized sigma24 family protein
MRTFRQRANILPLEVVDWAPNAEQLYWVSELRQILTQTLEEVRPPLRAVFVLRDIEGLSIDQTAVVLGLSQAAVKARLWRARLQLREGLNRYFIKREDSETVDVRSARLTTETLGGARDGSNRWLAV